MVPSALKVHGILAWPDEPRKRGAESEAFGGFHEDGFSAVATVVS